MLCPTNVINHLHFKQELKGSTILNNEVLGINMGTDISGLTDRIKIQFRYKKVKQTLMNQDKYDSKPKISVAILFFDITGSGHSHLQLVGR